MEIINNTMYNRDLILRYNKYYSRSYMIKNFIIITIISFGFAIYMATQQEWAYAALLLGILVAYYVLTYVMQKLTTSKMLKRSPLVDNPMLQTYVFKDNEVSVTNVKGYIVNYNEVVKVKLAPDFYMLQTHDRKTFIVDFNGFESEADRLQLEKFFSERFNLKQKRSNSQ